MDEDEDEDDFDDNKLVITNIFINKMFILLKVFLA